MLVLLSPSKTQDFETAPPVGDFSLPALLDESEQLVRELRKLSTPAIGKLMGVSDKIATLNRARYRAFRTPFTPDNARPAAFAFTGDVYDGFKARSLSRESLAFAQSHVRILSGLYGVLKPLDLIQPYRLEMKIRLKNPRGRDLYQFWGDRLTRLLRQELEATGERTVVNLASQEYFRVVQPQALSASLITPQFLEKKNGSYRMIALFAKQARGSMAHYVAERRVSDPEALQFFAEDGYRLNVGLSKPGAPAYTRG